MEPQYIGFGLLVGTLVGLTGIGGGSLMTPLLILGGGVPPAMAIGTDLAYGAITKTVGGWRHLRIGTVDLGVSKWLAFGSVPGSLIGVWLTHQLERWVGKDFDSVLLVGVAIALSIVAIAILYRVLFMPGAADRERHSVELSRRVKVQAVTIGLVMGAILGMTSVGSGALIGLALILVFRLTPHRVVGTDVFHAAILLWTAALAHGVAGNVDLVLAGTLLIGSVPGVWLGTWLLPRIPAAGLRPALACVLLASALAVLSKAGAEIPPWVIISAPLAAGCAAAIVHRRRTRLEAVPA
ncbi:sulfite exporter TauE/SafE family protein [Patulibacter defluvii]|uniref:sulfite exporter TauE/SafE family protein n=1 Tax=Patulibacter defluvii TaxID=3095358 RepID=UPI002A75ABBF|nr:sulfite exporter TauE/SafE family protein [Patulibacter sp. DM4]